MDITAMPYACRDGLVVQDLPPDEVLVYDTARGKAHCLNRTAALVWRACDGQTSVEAIARRVKGDMGAASLDEAQDAVWLALDRLSRANLLQQPMTPPLVAAGMSRREFVQKLGVASLVLIPGVSSVRIPSQLQTGSPGQSGGSGPNPTPTSSGGSAPIATPKPATCIAAGQRCSTSSGLPCCPGLRCVSFGYNSVCM